jgi:hypothetical protein
VTIQPSTLADRLDHAVELLLNGHPAPTAAAMAHLGRDDRGLVQAASQARLALATPPVGSRFEARLGARLSEAAHADNAVAWALRHPGRLIVTGAVGSAVGVGVTAFAVWRSSRRTTRAANRLLHR